MSSLFNKVLLLYLPFLQTAFALQDSSAATRTNFIRTFIQVDEIPIPIPMEYAHPCYHEASMQKQPWGCCLNGCHCSLMQIAGIMVISLSVFAFSCISAHRAPAGAQTPVILVAEPNFGYSPTSAQLPPKPQHHKLLPHVPLRKERDLPDPQRLKPHRLIE